MRTRVPPAAAVPVFVLSGRDPGLAAATDFAGEEVFDGEDFFDGADFASDGARKGIDPALPFFGASLAALLLLLGRAPFFPATLNLPYRFEPEQ